MVHSVLIVDDEADIRNLISDCLQDEEYETRIASTDLQAFSMLDEVVPTVVILDIWLQGSELDGLGILEIIKRKYPYLPVIMISGHGNIETAVNALKMGAYDYIEKPFTEDKLLIIVKRACEAAKLQKENAELRMYSHEAYKIVGNSTAINILKQSILKIAPTSSRVLITGQHGSGKKLVAKLIHEKSKRKDHPFIVFNAAGMSEEKAYLELFGEESKNIFSTPRKVGVLELANNGTLFIDEVTDLPLNIQSKILNFLQSHSFTRNGGKSAIKLDVRIVSSTSKDLKEETAKGRFREDLFYRLNVIQIQVPSLFAHKEDIQVISEFFLKYFHDFGGFPLRQLSADAVIALQNYSWPGNIRQLRNVIEWVLIMHNNNSEKLITSNMLPPELINTGNNNSSFVEINENYGNNTYEMIDLPLREAREMFEKQYLSKQLIRFDHNITKMSTAIGMERSALHRKLKTLGVTTDEE
ncbi:MAG: sigma-54 dependent transcriptional regulator [Pseudomonadota bacterium]